MGDLTVQTMHNRLPWATSSAAVLWRLLERKKIVILTWKTIFMVYKRRFNNCTKVKTICGQNMKLIHALL